MPAARGYDGPDGNIPFYFYKTEAVQWQEGRVQGVSTKVRHGRRMGAVQGPKAGHKE